MQYPYFQRQTKNICIIRQSQFNSGPCKVYVHASTIVIQHQQNNLDIPKRTKLIRLKQISYSNYLLSNQSQGGFYAISIPNQDSVIQQFQSFISQISEIIDYYSMSPDLQIKQKIGIDCPIGQPGEQIGEHQVDKLDNVGQGIGGAFGSISALIDSSRYNRETSSKISQISRNTFSEKTFSKWDRFKLKCSNLNDSMTQALKPVSDKCKEIVDEIGTKFNNSQNQYIKKVRQLSKKTQKALNKGYEQKDAPKRQSTTPQSNNQNPRPETGSVRNTLM